MSTRIATKGLFGTSITITTMGRFRNLVSRFLKITKKFITNSRIYYWITGMRFYR